jgi:hypothetical protein
MGHRDLLVTQTYLRSKATTAPFIPREASAAGWLRSNALVLRDLANLCVGDNPEVGSSVLFIGVAWIQSNFEPMRKQVALFEL